MTRIQALLLAAAWPAVAAAANTPFADLEKRLSTDGVDKTNIYLVAQASSALSSLHFSTAQCDLQAVSLTVRLARARKSKVVDAHNDALRTAVGNCTGFVLSLLSAKEVPTVCSSIASWKVTQMARELRQRIKNLESDELLLSTAHGKACRDAYRYELHNTRVGLKVGPR